MRNDFYFLPASFPASWSVEKSINAHCCRKNRRVFFHPMPRGRVKSRWREHDDAVVSASLASPFTLSPLAPHIFLLPYSLSRSFPLIRFFLFLPPFQPLPFIFSLEAGVRTLCSGRERERERGGRERRAKGKKQERGKGR